MHFKDEDPFEGMVAEGMSQLGSSADGTMQVFLSLSLQVCAQNADFRDRYFITLQTMQEFDGHGHIFLRCLFTENVEE